MLVLGIHSGWQDAGAAVFDEYRPLAAVSLARISGIAHDGGRLPLEAIEACLAIANLGRGEIGAVALSPGLFPSRYLTGLSLARRVSRRLRRLISGETPASLAEESRRARREGKGAGAALDTVALLGDLGLNRHIPVHVFSESSAQALLPLAQTDWQEALLFTADGGGHSARVLRYGRLADFYADDMTQDGIGQLVALAIDGLGLPDAEALFALAPYGEPILAQALLAHIRIDDDGRIATDFSQDGGAAQWLRRLAEGHPPAVVAASLQKMLQIVYGQALFRLMQRHGLSHLALGGALFANPALLHALAAQLVPQGLTAYPAADEVLAMGGVLDFLQVRDGVSDWLRHRAEFAAACHAVPSGRDYSADIDPVLGNAGCRLVSQDAARAAAALLNAGKSVAFYGRQAVGPRGGAARAVLFAASKAGAAGAANRRLDRPEMMPQTLYLRRERAGELLETVPSTPGMAARLAPRWRARLQGALAPDLLCRPHLLDDDSDAGFCALFDAYAGLSGLPALLGLPMQVDGSAPLDLPSEALRLLIEDRVDYIATEQAVWERGG